jgi:hypothetical protein
MRIFLKSIACGMLYYLGTIYYLGFNDLLMSTLIGISLMICVIIMIFT